MRAPWLAVLILARILDPSLVHGEHACHRNDTGFGVPGQRSSERILSRRRRLTFPRGSTFVLTVSILQPVQIRLPSNWNLDFEFDMVWPIPVEKKPRKKHVARKPWMVKRRHRRELYATFEAALNSRDLPGRRCVLMTICEAKTLLSPPGVSFIEDVVRSILANVEEVDEHDSYDMAYKTETRCDAAYPCPVPILKLLLFNLYLDTPALE